jgi:general secretion pathway protein K
MPTGWLGIERALPLPDGAIVRARVEDGGNCFNLNSLAQRTSDGRLISRPVAVKQFAALMTGLGIDSGKAAQIAASASDYVDSDSFPINLGSEDGTDVTPPNQLMADPSELRAVANVGTSDYQRLRRWICALPTTDPSPLNINTLLPDQAPLLAMLNAGNLDAARARTALAMRPRTGYANAGEFWQLPVFAGIPPPLEAADQLRTRTDFFLLTARVRGGGTEAAEIALIDARTKPARVVARRWTDEG